MNRGWGVGKSNTEGRPLERVRRRSSRFPGLGFALIGGAEHGLLDALYMTVITLTTVGFGEIIDMSNSPAGRVFTILLLGVGFAIVLYAVPMMTAFVIEGQLLNVFARRRMDKTIRSMSDHYVVTGGTAVASHVVEEQGQHPGCTHCPAPSPRGLASLPRPSVSKPKSSC